MSTPNEMINVYFAAKSGVHDLFGYRPDWVEIPLDDQRKRYWMLVGGEGYGGRCVWSDEPFTKESIESGSKIYSGSIYTQRFLPKWVYRSGSHVLVAVDTHTDGNKFLMIFDAALECVDEKMRESHAACW